MRFGKNHGGGDLEDRRQKAEVRRQKIRSWDNRNRDPDRKGKTIAIRIAILMLSEKVNLQMAK